MLELGSMVEEKKLNEEQRGAVGYRRGPLLIIAGAGTGKTTVVTERIKYIISKNLAKPSEILALTFTEKAAKEMQDRVDEGLPYGYTQMWISTFHSFCDRILRSEGLSIGLNPNYKLNTEAESVQFFRKNLFAFKLDYFRPLGNPNKFIEGILQHFSRLQDEDVTSEEYLGWLSLKNKNRKPKLSEEEKFEIKKWTELAGAYKVYNQLKSQEGYLDFGDLILKTLELFRKRPNVLKRYRELFKYYLVDEFQDTNVAQYELLKLLAPPSKKINLTVVGDDSQSVYKFRGAAISNIIYFKRDYKWAKTVVLVKNYRSSQNILDAAYRLIQFNNPDTLEAKLGVDKNLLSVSHTREESVNFIHLDRVENEAEAVIREIVKLKGAKGSKYNYKDFAILIRANNHSEPFIRALVRNAVPYQFLGPGKLFRQDEIVDLISYLKVLYDYNDNISLFRFLSMVELGISNKDLIALVNYSKKNNTTLYEALKNTDNVGISEGSGVKINHLLKVLEKHLEMSRKESAGQLLYYFLEEMELLPKLLNPDDSETQKKAQNISKLFDKLKTYEADHQGSSVREVVDWIDLATELGESPLATNVDWSDIDAVNILTVHSAKGLEFPVVFLVNLVSQRFPSMERSERIPIPEELIKEVLPIGDFHLQEERRLCYVGMTRAKERLYLTAADYYGEGKREKNLSPFIFESLGDEAIRSEQGGVKGKQLSFLEYKNRETVPPISILPIAHIDYLSFSQIDTFLTCPMHFKLAYIIKIPTIPSASLSFGSTIHKTLKDFYEEIKLGKAASEKMILKILNTNWLHEGYLTKIHEEKFYDKAKIYLRDFIKNEFSIKKLPFLLEQKFIFSLPNKERERPLKIGGVMDRVDVLRNGIIEIVDYKTSAKIPTQKEVDSNFQLTIYALAATRIYEQPFQKNPDEVKLSLYYFDNQEKITTSRTQEDLRQAVERIYKVRNDIENSDFKCSGSYLCRNCEYKMFCTSDSQQ